jgi:hypothetical protein
MPGERRKESNGRMEDCRGGGGGVGGGGVARVEVEDVGQWDMRGGYTEITGSINMQCVCLKKS